MVVVLGRVLSLSLAVLTGAQGNLGLSHDFPVEELITACRNGSSIQVDAQGWSDAECLMQGQEAASKLQELAHNDLELPPETPAVILEVLNYLTQVNTTALESVETCADLAAAAAGLCDEMVSISAMVLPYMIVVVCAVFVVVCCCCTTLLCICCLCGCCCFAARRSPRPPTFQKVPVVQGQALVMK